MTLAPKWVLEAGLYPEYRAYSSAKVRCTAPSNRYYKDYGGRGITFEFTSFKQFITELGPRPTEHQLDRIDNNKGYMPGNVRWATRSENQRNKRPAGLSTQNPGKSGAQGIHQRPDGFVARFKKVHIGFYKTFDEAKKARDEFLNK